MIMSCLLPYQKKEQQKIMSKSITIALKPIHKSHSYSNFKPKSYTHYRQKLDFVDQQIPTLKEDCQCEQPKIIKSQILFDMIQDPRKTFFVYKKFLFIQKTLFLLTFLSFFISVVKTEIQLSQGNQFIKIIWNCNSTSALALMFCLFLRYLTLFELKVHQKKVYVQNFKQEESLVATFLMKSSGDCYYMLIQMLMILPHANALFLDKTVTLFQSYDELYIVFDINDILSIVQLFRVYIVLRSLVNISIYSSPRSSRLCQQNGVEHNLLYSIKCILNEDPLKAICIVFIITLIFQGVGLKLSQGVLAKNNPNLPSTGFQQYVNCFWCVFIAMSTVGYGDYYPKTSLGRGIIFATALTGIVLSSILIVSLSAYLEMQASESKSHITLMRLKQQEVLKEQATQALCSTIKLFKKMSAKQPKHSQKLKVIFSELKRKIDLVKLRTKKIKCLVDTDNILEEMHRLFQLLKDNLRDVYENQSIMKSVIQKIKLPTRTRRSGKLSFVKQMQRAIDTLQQKK